MAGRTAQTHSDATVTPQNTLERNLAILNAAAWRPEPNTYRTGNLIAVRRGGIGGEYGEYPILVMEDKDGIFAVHAFHTLLINYLKEIKPRRGEELTVWYGGQRESGKRVDSKGDPVKYHHYTVVKGDGSDMDMNDFTWDE